MNKEYIERETIIEQIIKMRDTFTPTVRPMFDVFKHITTEAPAADVEPVRHGEWIEEWGQSYLVFPMKYDKYGLPLLQDYVSYVCSQCCRRASEKYPYCHCGAKMDRGKE